MPRTGRPIVDIAGQRFGRLVVLKRIPTTQQQARWLCQCDCGKMAEANGLPLRTGKKRSCGCLIIEQAARKHANGVKSQNFAEYCAWSQAKARCYDVNHQAYKDYGARGIRMSEEWRSSFRQFLADMGKRPSPKDTLDRVNNQGDYSAANCRWATFIVQANNRRGNRFLEMNGRTMTIAQWARELGFRKSKIHNRLRAGWSVERALTE